MQRRAKPEHARDCPSLEQLCLTAEALRGAVDYVHDVLDAIDQKLIESSTDRLSRLVELANLSAIIGNLFRGGLVRHSYGRFRANEPHTYPDMLAVAEGCPNIEIKVALEQNKPKGHLVKSGAHVTVRYVLSAPDGRFTRGRANRGEVVWIWEVRAGYLSDEHFRFSSTEGDSGKTAVISAEGMGQLDVVYFNPEHCPLAAKNLGLLRRLFNPPPPQEQPSASP